MEQMSYDALLAWKDTLEEEVGVLRSTIVKMARACRAPNTGVRDARGNDLEEGDRVRSILTWPGDDSCDGVIVWDKGAYLIRWGRPQWDDELLSSRTDDVVKVL